MTELSHLSRAEKVFFAGCIREVMLADGSIREAELKDLNRIYGRLGFHGYEECLDEFEEKASEDFFITASPGRPIRPADAGGSAAGTALPPPGAGRRRGWAQRCRIARRPAPEP